MFLSARSQRMYKDEDGATAIEFAVVFPIFIFVLMGVFEYCMILYLRGTIEEATRSTARLGIAGSTYDAKVGTSRDVFLRDELQKRLDLVVFNPDNLTVITKIYDTLEDFNTDSSSGAVTSAYGSGKQIIEYTVTYNHEFFTPLASLANGMDDHFQIISTVFAKNEDF